MLGDAGFFPFELVQCGEQEAAGGFDGDVGLAGHSQPYFRRRVMECH